MIAFLLVILTCNCLTVMCQLPTLQFDLFISIRETIVATSRGILRFHYRHINSWLLVLVTSYIIILILIEQRQLTKRKRDSFGQMT